MRAREPISLVVQGLRLEGFVWRAADPAAKCVLALHGWLDNAESFTPLAAHLHQFTIVAIDLPGHGHSQHRSADAGYHFIDWVATVVGILDALQWQRAALMGHSMGAAASVLTAGTLPDRVEALILLDALAPFTAEADEMPGRLVRHLSEGSRRTSRAMRPYASIAQAVSSLCRVVPLLSAPHAELLVTRNTRAVEGGVVWRGDPRLRGTSVMTLTESQLHVFLERVAAPALFVRAPDGMAWDEAALARHAQKIRGLKTVQILGGHHVHMEQAPQVAQVVVPWLSQQGLLAPATAV